MNMKLPLALFLAAAKGVSAAMGSIPLNSPTGLRMMKHARQHETFSQRYIYLMFFCKYEVSEYNCFVDASSGLN